MADMSVINANVDGTAYAFRLLEADIPALTFRNVVDPPPVFNGGNDFASFMAMTKAAGINIQSGQPRNVDGFYCPGLFFDLVRPTGLGDYVFVMPIGKALLARVAAVMPNGFYQLQVQAILTFALKGTGTALQGAGGVADNLARSYQSGPGNRGHYVTNVLVPQILSAAAAA